MDDTNDVKKTVEGINHAGDYGTTPVPIGSRKGIFSLSMVTAGFTISMSGLFTGAALAQGLSLRNAIIANILGNIIICLYSGSIAAIGAKYGVSASMLSREAFGRKGAKIIGLIIAITLTGWYSAQCGFFGQTINTLFPNGGFLTSVRVAALWGGILMMLTAIFGFKGLQYLSNFGIPILIAVSAYGIYLSVGNVGNGQMTFNVNTPITLVQGVVMAVGSFAVGGVIQADISRYARSMKDSWISTGVGFLFGNIFIISAGIIMIKATGDGNLPSAMVKVGLGGLGLFVLMIAQWTTNDNNLYSSSLGILHLIPNVKKSTITAILGAVATLIGAAGFYIYFIPFLTTLGSIIPPIAGVIIADYYLIKKKYDFSKDAKYASWNISSFISIILGALVGIYVKQGISSVNAIASALITQYILIKLFNDKLIIPSSITKSE